MQPRGLGCPGIQEPRRYLHPAVHADRKLRWFRGRGQIIWMRQKGGFRALESADGSYLYYAKGRGKPGLWRRELLSNSGADESVLESLQQWGWWALGPDSVYFLELPYAVNPQVRLKALNVKTGRIDELARLAFPVLTATPALAVSRDGQLLAYSQIDSMEADIMLLQKLN